LRRLQTRRWRGGPPQRENLGERTFLKQAYEQKQKRHHCCLLGSDAVPFIYGLFNDAVSSSGYTESSAKIWNESERMRSQPTFRHPGIYLEGPRKTSKNLSGRSVSQPGIERGSWRIRSVYLFGNAIYSGRSYQKCIA
jgi:hypothetical protein